MATKLLSPSLKRKIENKENQGQKRINFRATKINLPAEKVQVTPRLKLDHQVFSSQPTETTQQSTYRSNDLDRKVKELTVLFRDSKNSDSMKHIIKQSLSSSIIRNKINQDFLKKRGNTTLSQAFKRHASPFKGQKMSTTANFGTSEVLTPTKKPKLNVLQKSLPLSARKTSGLKEREPRLDFTNGRSQNTYIYLNLSKPGLSMNSSAKSQKKQYETKSPLKSNRKLHPSVKPFLNCSSLCMSRESIHSQVNMGIKKGTLMKGLAMPKAVKIDSTSKKVTSISQKSIYRHLSIDVGHSAVNQERQESEDAFVQKVYNRLLQLKYGQTTRLNDAS